jgi:hypothetical protein
MAMAVGGAALAGAIRARRAQARAVRDFNAWAGSTEPWPAVDGIPARCPAYVNRVELFGSFHPADLAAVASALPSDAIHPVRLPDGRAIMFVGGLHYRDITSAAFAGAMTPPYGEVMIAAMVSRADAPPVLPLVAGTLPLPGAWRAGMFQLSLPVTQRWTRDAAWAMGLPKFVADLDFEERADAREVRAAEGGRSILRLRVPAAGRVRLAHAPMLTFAASEGTLFEVESPILAYQHMGLGGRGVELELGDHPVARQARDLGLSMDAIGTLSWVAGRVILPERHAVGPARPFTAYRGEDRWFGRYTIRYPGTEPVDQYAYLTRQGIERAILRGGGTLLPDYASLDDDLEGGGESAAPASDIARLAEVG